MAINNVLKGKYSPPSSPKPSNTAALKKAAINDKKSSIDKTTKNLVDKTSVKEALVQKAEAAKTASTIAKNEVEKLKKSWSQSSTNTNNQKQSITQVAAVPTGWPITNEDLKKANSALNYAENKERESIIDVNKHDELHVTQVPGVKTEQSVGNLPQQDQNVFTPLDKNINDYSKANKNSDLAETWSPPPSEETSQKNPGTVYANRSNGTGKQSHFVDDNQNSKSNTSSNVSENYIIKNLPSIMLVSRFDNLVNQTGENYTFNNGDFDSTNIGNTFSKLTPTGQYFDLQVQSRYLDFLALQNIYKKLGQTAKTALDLLKDENTKLIEDLKQSMDALKTIFFSIESTTSQFFDYSELFQYLIDAKLLTNNSTAPQNWISLKIWNEYIASIINSIAGYAEVMTTFDDQVVINGPAEGYATNGVIESRERIILRTSKSTGNAQILLDRALSLAKFGEDPNYQMLSLSGYLTLNNGTYSDPVNNWLNLPRLTNYHPYKLFSLITQEILFSINEVFINSDNFKNMLGYRNYGKYEISALDIDYSKNTLASAPGVLTGEFGILISTLESEEKKILGKTLKPGKDYFITDAINSVNNNGILQNDKISELKNKFQSTIDNLENIKKYFYKTDKIEDAVLPYIHDPVNRIIKDLTTEESTLQKLVFTDAQSKNTQVQGEDTEYSVPGEPWVIGLIRHCFHFQNNQFDIARKVPTMWHLLDALLSDNPNKIELLVKKVIYLYQDKYENNSVADYDGNVGYLDPLGTGHFGEGKINELKNDPNTYISMWKKTEAEASGDKNYNKFYNLRQKAIIQRTTLIESFAQSETWSALTNIMKTYSKLLKLATVDGKTVFNGVHDLYILYVILNFCVDQVISKMPWGLVFDTRSYKVERYNVNNGVMEVLALNSVVYFYPYIDVKNKGEIDIQQLDCLMYPLNQVSDSNNSGASPQDLDINLSYRNPQKMLDKLSIFLYKKKGLIEKLQNDVITSGNLVKLTNLFVLDNGTQLKDVFDFTSTQVYSILNRLNDLSANFSKEFDVNLLNNQVITRRIAKTLIYNSVKSLPSGDIITVGIPKKFINSKIGETSKVIKIVLSRVNELETNKQYSDLTYYFDLNVFPILDFYKFGSTFNVGVGLRTFKSDFSFNEFSNSTSHYPAELSQEIKDSINYNHKFSTIFDLYLSIFTGIQVNESSVFSSQVTNYINSVNGLMTTNQIKDLILKDPLYNTTNLNTKSQIDLFLNTLNTFSDGKMLKMFTTHPTHYDRVFNIFVPHTGTPESAIWEYQVSIDDGIIPKYWHSFKGSGTTSGSDTQDPINKKDEGYGKSWVYGDKNPDHVTRYEDSSAAYSKLDNTNWAKASSGTFNNSLSTSNIKTSRGI